MNNKFKKVIRRQCHWWERHPAAIASPGPTCIFSRLLTPCFHAQLRTAEPNGLTAMEDATRPAPRRQRLRHTHRAPLPLKGTKPAVITGPPARSMKKRRQRIKKEFGPCRPILMEATRPLGKPSTDQPALHESLEKTTGEATNRSKLDPSRPCGILRSKESGSGTEPGLALRPLTRPPTAAAAKG